MDDIFEGKAKQPSKFKQIMIETLVAEKLKAMNKGSHNEAIKWLLNMSPGSKLESDIKQLKDDVLKLQEALERLVQSNHLRL